MAKKEVMRSKKKKGAIELDILGWWILGIVVLVIVVIVIITLKGKATGLLELIKDIFRFKK